MVKYLNYLRYLDNVEKVTVDERHNSVVFHGRDTEDRETYKYLKEPPFDMTNTDLILAQLDSRTDIYHPKLDDRMFVTLLNPDTCITTMVQGTSGLLEFLRHSYVMNKCNMTLSVSEADTQRIEQLKAFRAFITQILTLEHLTILECDEDTEYIKYRYKHSNNNLFSEGELIGTNAYVDSKLCHVYKALKHGMTISVGMYQLESETISNFDEFKKYVKGIQYQSIQF